ncbi:hypothetical protein DRN97_08700 [Methanosarcinales archaeon]|nr:MAG: hypothetical protein DRN97_08700 [Methanosarcinales archaeon]
MEKRRTILAGLVSIVLLIGTPFMTAQAAPAVVSVSPPSVDVSQGQTFTVNITVDPKGNEICAAQYVLLYSDNNLLNATSQTQGPFLSQDGLETIVVANIINNTLGKVEYGEFRTGEGLEHGVTAPGALASITFEVIGTSGRSNLKLSDVILLDPNEEELETEINDGTVTIGKVTGEPAIADITVEEAHEMMEADPEEIILLDVRTEEEYEERHIPDAVNIPLSELESRIGELDKYKSKKIIVYCKTGSRSRTASEILVQNGFKNVYNMLGGIEEWRINFPPSSLLTPAPTPTPSLSLSPSATPAAAASPLASPTPERKWGLPGFEAVFAILGLLATSYLILKRRRADKK